MSILTHYGNSHHQIYQYVLFHCGRSLVSKVPPVIMIDQLNNTQFKVYKHAHHGAAQQALWLFGGRHRCSCYKAADSESESNDISSSLASSS